MHKLAKKRWRGFRPLQLFSYLSLFPRKVRESVIETDVWAPPLPPREPPPPPPPLPSDLNLMPIDEPPPGTILLAPSDKIFDNPLEELKARRPLVEANPDINESILDEQRQIYAENEERKRKEKEEWLNPFHLSTQERNVTPNPDLAFALANELKEVFAKRNPTKTRRKKPQRKTPGKLHMDPAFLAELSKHYGGKGRIRTRRQRTRRQYYSFY